VFFDSVVENGGAMRKLMLGALGLATLLAGCWVWAAWRAGVFLVDRSVVAAALDDPQVEAFSRRKRYVDVGPWRVATIDEGTGDAVVLLHGCPFHAFEWRDVIPRLSDRYRVIAPDLLGLGDTQVRLDQDYRLPQDVEMVVGLLDRLGIDRAHFVGHDHGGATVQIMMQRHPERLRSVVLTNAEAYDAWPSAPERPYLELVVSPVLSPLFRTALTFPAAGRKVFEIAVHRKEAFTDEVLAAYLRAHTATPARWQRLVRFFRWQLDRDHNREPLRALDGMRRFQRPTLLLWGKQDTNFGPALAQRLASDIPGTVRIEWLEHSAHMPMQEEPERYAAALRAFLDEVAARERREAADAEDR
jgi:pimeloyl-ACP methyl ester carboxylesterase